MADIFGSAGGTSAAYSDMQRLATTEGIKAQTQGQQIQNQAGQMELQEHAQMQALMRQQAGKPGENDKPMAERMEDMAKLAYSAGLTTQGAKMAGDAAALRLKQAQTVHAQSQTLHEQASAAKDQLTMVEKLLGGVTDQASWDAANSLFKSMMGKQSPYEGMEYNPAFVAQLQQQTLSLKDQIDLGIKKYNAETQRRNSDSNASFREFRKGYMNDEMALRRDREDRLRKGGGKTADVGTPVKAELDHASDLIQQAYPDLPQDEINNAAFSIASRARAIRKSTPGMDADSATQRALKEARDSGQFQTLNDNYKFMGLPIPGTSKSTTHFGKTGKGGASDPGSSPDKPIDTIPPSPKDRKVGAYYSHGGKVYKWAGNGWTATDGGDE